MRFLKSRFDCTTVFELTFRNLTYLGIRNNDKNTIDSCPNAALNGPNLNVLDKNVIKVRPFMRDIGLRDRS